MQNTLRTYEPAKSRATAQEIQRELDFLRAMAGRHSLNRRRKWLTVEDWLGMAFLVCLGVILGAIAALVFSL